MKLIFSALLIFGVVWLVMFIGSLLGYLGLIFLRIFVIFGIPALVIGSVYKILKR
ncbi:hypothetical protein [Clostridium scatologenes]|uniref:Uncharacterized protein n=1 Tax=Clostridium scatologenes TaxID=1548 RepID=A0A0E3M9A3_CLOSL|nr:hypothetical protein [Clostridium scatologenes]AKA70875.1 hypothetical protein CSCA_3750 [Clostridium scatologenes]